MIAVDNNQAVEGLVVTEMILGNLWRRNGHRPFPLLAQARWAGWCR